MQRSLTATYRLQLTREFPFSAVRQHVRYFAALGASHLYLSPILAARPGSAHGYDVIDPTMVNPELGTEDELRALAADLHARGMGIILDIVPNHMAASEDNPYWDDVLLRGSASRYADWFDIDWGAPHAKGKVLLPVLGDELDRVIDRGEMALRVRETGSRASYFDRTFPLDPATLPKEIQLAQLDPAARRAADQWASGPEGKRRLRELLDAQHYRLTFWRNRRQEVNYRRFFDVADLVAVRMETEELFETTHRLILGWIREGVVDGLRVDHVDGLRHPAWYLGRLRQAADAMKHPDAPARFPIFVEKILSGDETLPTDWPVDGTTGYDFLNDVEDLFLDPAGFREIEAKYRSLRRASSPEFATAKREGKRRALVEALRPDVARLARIAHEWRRHISEREFAGAIVELIVHLDVYRTYVIEPGAVSEQDRRALTAALRDARKNDAVSQPALAALGQAFLADPTPGDAWRSELVSRFQQTSGPATAKGVEDTALYVYIPLASRNEVGGAPDRPLDDAPARMHQRNETRMRRWPSALLASNTHDTKRSADLRSRLDVLTSISTIWARHVARWRRLNRPHKSVVRGKPAPDTNAEYLYYQTLPGLWPAPRPRRRKDDLPDRRWLERTRGRLVAYMLKAAREAKTSTSWTESDSDYEQALDTFVRGTLDPGDEAPFMGDVARLTAEIADDGFRFSLARILLQFLSPGTPDLYQGDELWTFSLVDPDNRRPVDFELRARLFAADGASDALRRALAGEGPVMEDRVKLALIARLLRFRREHQTLLSEGDYVPLAMAGTGFPTDAFTFARRHGDATCIAIARTRRFEEDSELRGVVRIPLPAELAGRWRSVLTDREIELVSVRSQLTAAAGDLVAPRQPCELLIRLDR